MQMTGTICEMTKVATVNAEKNLHYWLDRLVNETEGGWPPETMPMMDLKAAAQILRSLANTIEQQRTRLTDNKETENV
jgi:hypothetical protein